MFGILYAYVYFWLHVTLYAVHSLLPVNIDSFSYSCTHISFGSEIGSEQMAREPAEQLHPCLSHDLLTEKCGRNNYPGNKQ